MDSRNLNASVDSVGSSGVILSPEQRSSLQTSLCILQNNNKFSKVYFWGKILGIKADYFIAQGVKQDELGEKRTFYSKDCVNWVLLNPATEEVQKQSQMVKGRFMGDPAHEFERVLTKKVGEGDEATEEEETILVKEEDRLSVVISEIDHDVAIVPRGAFVRDPTGKVYENRSFSGLLIAEAAKIGNYFHFRSAEKLEEKSLLQRANLDKSIDFMDSIDDDIPKGSWSVQFERGSAMLTIRSLLWCGYVFYHIPGSPNFGSVYVGTGEKNKDLPFML